MGQRGKRSARTHRLKPADNVTDVWRHNAIVKGMKSCKTQKDPKAVKVSSSGSKYEIELNISQILKKVKDKNRKNREEKYST